MASDILLRSVPDDILKIILARQKAEKEKHGVKQFSQSYVIIKMLRECKK